MKHLLALLLLLTGVVTSCKKGNDVTNSTASSGFIVTPPQPPTASFKITNSNDHGVLEANILDFQNMSSNGDSYKWDFGNGMSSTDKVPTNFYYGTCGATFTITLTVTNKTGQTATYSEYYHVACTRGGVAHDPIKTPTHI